MAFLPGSFARSHYHPTELDTEWPAHRLFASAGPAPTIERRNAMLRFALFGAGRIGAMHAANIAANPRAKLQCVYDVHKPTAEKVAQAHGAAVAASVDEALSGVDAVLIASSTDTHVDLITAAAKAGKPILCEKPIDLDISRVE